MLIRRMFSTTPSGLVPASNSSLCSRPAFSTVTSTENPCSAISASAPLPSAESPRRSLVGHEDVGDVVHKRRHHDGVDRLEVERGGQLDVTGQSRRRAVDAMVHAHCAILSVSSDVSHEPQWLTRDSYKSGHVTRLSEVVPQSLAWPRACRHLPAVS
jgi:hypothetical protein